MPRKNYWSIMRVIRWWEKQPESDSRLCSPSDCLRARRDLPSTFHPSDASDEPLSLPLLAIGGITSYGRQWVHRFRMKVRRGAPINGETCPRRSPARLLLVGTSVRRSRQLLATEPRARKREREARTRVYETLNASQHCRLADRGIACTADSIAEKQQ